MHGPHDQQQQAWTPGAATGDVGGYGSYDGGYGLPDEGTAWWGIGTAGATLFLLGVGAALKWWLLVGIGAGLYLIVSTIAGIWVLVAAFTESLTQGLLSLFVPMYIVYFSTTSAVGKTLKWLYWTNMGTGIVIGFGVFFAFQNLAGGMMNTECRQVLVQEQQLEATLTAFSTEVRSAGSNPDAMARVWTKHSRILRNRLQQFGELSFSDPALEAKMVPYFELLLQMPDLMEGVGRAFTMGNNQLAVTRTQDFQKLTARITPLENDIGKYCGFKVGNPTP